MNIRVNLVARVDILFELILNNQTGKYWRTRDDARSPACLDSTLLTLLRNTQIKSKITTGRNGLQLINSYISFKRKVDASLFHPCISLRILRGEYEKSHLLFYFPLSNPAACSFPLLCHLINEELL